MITRILLLISVFTLCVMAADVNGKWTAKVPGRNGQTRDQNFTFKVDGAKLTGSTTGFQGNEQPISDGKVDGDKITFTVKVEFNGNAITMNYEGTLSGDEIKMKQKSERGDREFVAKRP